MSEYTEMDLIAQAMVAFGQGARDMRVSHTACRAVIERYQPWISNKNMLKGWDKEAVQILERVKALGRMAADNATKEGKTAISGAHVTAAIPVMEKASATDYCPPNPDGGG